MESNRLFQITVKWLKLVSKDKFCRSPPEHKYEYWYRKAMQKTFDEGYPRRLSAEVVDEQSG
jgi:hypothetical protein